MLICCIENLMAHCQCDDFCQQQSATRQEIYFQQRFSFIMKCFSIIQMRIVLSANT